MGPRFFSEREAHASHGSPGESLADYRDQLLNVRAVSRVIVPEGAVGLAAASPEVEGHGSDPVREQVPANASYVLTLRGALEAVQDDDRGCFCIGLGGPVDVEEVPVRSLESFAVVRWPVP